MEGRGSSPNPSTLTVRHPDRWTWTPGIDPTRCRHPYRAFHLGTLERLDQRCGGCGAVLAARQRCWPATNKKSNRHCRLPGRADFEDPTCATYRPERGGEQ